MVSLNDQYKIEISMTQTKELKKTMTYRKVAMAQAFVESGPVL